MKQMVEWGGALLVAFVLGSLFWYALLAPAGVLR
jgi:hypothetical protein